MSADQVYKWRFLDCLVQGHECLTIHRMTNANISKLLGFSFSVGGDTGCCYAFVHKMDKLYKPAQWERHFSASAKTFRLIFGTETAYSKQKINKNMK